METKNVIAAIAMSSAVIVLYSLFFVPENTNTKQNLDEKKIEQNTDAPSLDQKEKLVQVSREEALKENGRIKFENKSIVGSISLKGAAIDDLTFKNYKIKLDSEEKVTLLNPKNVPNGYLIESGFVTNDKNIDIPNSNTIWQVTGNNILTNKSPVKIIWKNKQGIIFEKKISLDDNFLFSINQKIINPTDKKYDFYSYGQIIRNKIPEGLSNFYILHEGPIATLDDELIEKDYDDIQDQKFSKTAQKGWLGVGDKYFIASIIPPKNKEFKTTFDYKNKFRANFINNEPFQLNQDSFIEDSLKVIVAAKKSRCY